MTTPGADLPVTLSDLVGDGLAAAIVRLRALRDPGPVLAAMADEAERLAIGDVDASVSATAGLVAAADALGKAGPRCRARRARGQALAYANRFADALAVLDEGVAIARTGSEPLEAARLGVAQLHALARLGRLQEAVRVGLAAHATLVSLGETMLAAKADVNIGVVQRMLDDPASALEHFTRALPVLADSPVIAAQVQSNRGEALLDLCDFQGAEGAFRSALEVFEEAGVARAASIAEGNLADLLSRQGRLGEALHHFQRARLRMEESAAAGDAARLRIEEAEVHAAVGLLDESTAGYKESIPILDRMGMASEAARARLGFGRVLGLGDNLPEAAARTLEAVETFRQIGQTAATARATLSLGQIRLMEGDRSAGVALVHEAMLALRDRPADLAAAHALLARAALNGGDPQGALAEADSGLALAKGVRLVHLVAVLRHLRGCALREQHQRTAAAEELHAAAIELDRLRGGLRLDLFRASFASTNAALSQDAVIAVLDAGGPAAAERAFDLVQRAKSGSLVDLLSGPRDDGQPASPDAKVLAELTTMNARLRALAQRIQDVGASRIGSRLDLVEQLEIAERQAEMLEARLKAGSQYRQLVGGAVDAWNILAALPERWAVVEYFATGADILVFVLRARDLSVHRLGAIDPVLEQMGRLRFQVGRALTRAAAGLSAGSASAMNHALEGLHDLLVRPITQQLEELDGVVVCPSGPLYAVPFHALRANDTHLAERLTVLHAPSGSVMSHMSVAHDRARGSGALLIGAADEFAPGIGDEVAALGELFPDSVQLSGSNTTLARVRELSSGRTLVHLASHGVFTPDAPIASGLKLADGWLTAREAATLPLAGTVVSLSGCDTGRVAVRAGDEIAGLLRAFLGSGARAILGTLWPAHDRTATDFLVNLYRTWYAGGDTGGKGLAAAAQAARQEAVVRGIHPAFWSHFFVVGAP